jgi:hypothetical protein
MILIALQIAVISGLGIYFLRWRSAVRRRNSQSWDSLLARLRLDWSARELSDQFLWKEGLNATPEDAWQRMEGPKGLWVMYQNARTIVTPWIACFLKPCAVTPCRFGYACSRPWLNTDSPKQARVSVSTPSAPPPCIPEWQHA